MKYNECLNQNDMGKKLKSSGAKKIVARTTFEEEEFGNNPVVRTGANVFGAIKIEKSEIDPNKIKIDPGDYE